MEVKDAIRLIFRLIEEGMKSFFKLLENLLPLVGKLLAWIAKMLSGSGRNQPTEQQRQPNSGRNIHVTAGPNDRVHIHRRRRGRKH